MKAMKYLLTAARRRLSSFVRPLPVVALAAVLLAWAPALHAQAPPKGSGTLEVTGPVRVIDGDTLESTSTVARRRLGSSGSRCPGSTLAAAGKRRS